MTKLADGLAFDTNGNERLPRYDVEGLELPAYETAVAPFVEVLRPFAVPGNPAEQVQVLTERLHDLLLARHMAFGEDPRSVRRCTRTPASRETYNRITTQINATERAIETAKAHPDAT